MNRRLRLAAWFVFVCSCSDGVVDQREVATDGNRGDVVLDSHAADAGRTSDTGSTLDVVADGDDAAIVDEGVVDDVVACTPDCAGRSCGDDGCGGSCGSCAMGQGCTDTGQCSASCAPACSGRSCGTDGCGGSCGSCATGQTCEDTTGTCIAPCAPMCSGRNCGADGCGGSCGTCASGSSCSSAGTCQASVMCTTNAEVVVYTAAAWNPLADAFAADASPCANYYFSIPAAGTPKTNPRLGETDRMHARGSHFHAMAEFHWTSWNMVTGMTWYQKGVELRRRMAAAGYDVTAGDTWAINELPSGVRSDATARQNARDAMRGLFDGPAGGPTARGAVFVIGMGQNTMGFSVYKPALESWLTDAAFWVDASNYARWWGQEVYTDPQWTCVPGTSTGLRAQHINAFVEHVGRLASVGPAGANTAQSYLSRAYTPLLNAVWNSAAGHGYGDTTIPLAQMEHHVSGQVYAVRAWATGHPYPDGRIGFAWDRNTGVTDTDLATLAARLASAVHYAYDAGGGSAAGACSPSGAFTWCQCSVSGATFNPAWDTFATW